MPAKSEKQRKFMGAELGRLRTGKKTETGMSERLLEDFASKAICQTPGRKIRSQGRGRGLGIGGGRGPLGRRRCLRDDIDNFISDRRIAKPMAKNDISKSTGMKTRTTLKTSTKLPKPKKMTMQNPGTAKNKKPPVKRMNIKKQVDVQKILPAIVAGGGKILASGAMKTAGKQAMMTAATNPKGFGEGIKAAGEGIKSASEGISNLRPTRKAIGAPGIGVPSVAPAAPMKTIPSMDKGLGSDYVKMPEPLNVMIRKAFTVLVPAIQKEMQKDLKKGTGGLIGTGLGGLAGAALGNPVTAGLGAIAGGAVGDNLSGGKSVAKKTKRINPAKNIDVKKVKKGTGGMIGTGIGGLAGAALGNPVTAGLGAVAGQAIGEEVGKSKERPLKKTCGSKKIKKNANQDKLSNLASSLPRAGKNPFTGELKVTRSPKQLKAPKVEKGWKQTAGMLGGAALGSAFGPIGAGAGAYAGKKLGDHLEKPKMAPKTATKARAPRAKTVSATRMMTTKNPRAKIVKAMVVKKGFLTEDNSVLTSTTKKIVRDSKDYHEEINDVLTKKQPDMERSELDMAKSQASLRVAKAIFYLKGYEPMDDSSVKKMFHGQIPEIMKSTEARPPQDWMEKAIKKSSGFAEDPIKYSMELWYDISKAVAEPIDSKMSPKKKGEDEQISDGTRCDTSDLVGKDKSETTETL